MDSLKLICTHDGRDFAEINDGLELSVETPTTYHSVLLNFDSVKRLNEWTTQWLEENGE